MSYAAIYQISNATQADGIMAYGTCSNIMD